MSSRHVEAIRRRVIAAGKRNVLTRGEQGTFEAVAHFAQASTGEAWPGVVKLAAWRRLERRQIGRHLTILRALGLLELMKPATRTCPVVWRLANGGDVPLTAGGLGVTDDAVERFRAELRGGREQGPIMGHPRVPSRTSDDATPERFSGDTHTRAEENPQEPVAHRPPGAVPPPTVGGHEHPLFVEGAGSRRSLVYASHPREGGQELAAASTRDSHATRTRLANSGPRTTSRSGANGSGRFVLVDNVWERTDEYVVPDPSKTRLLPDGTLIDEFGEPLPW